MMRRSEIHKGRNADLLFSESMLRKFKSDHQRETAAEKSNNAVVMALQRNQC